MSLPRNRGAGTTTDPSNSIGVPRSAWKWECNASRCHLPQTYGVDYDQGADDYAAHRRLHTGVYRELCEQTDPGPGSAVLEVGCGTGNYVRALAQRFHCVAYGLDPSPAMLDYARAQRERVTWVLGRAEELAFTDKAFDLIFSVDAIHHISDKAAFYREAARTLRPGSRVCTVTDSEEIIRSREVLSGYFPETVEIETRRYPRVAQLLAWMEEAGLIEMAEVAVEQPYKVTSTQPFRDKAYSSLRLISEQAWRAGLERLEGDLAHGPVRGMSRYVCLWGQKPGE